MRQPDKLEGAMNIGLTCSDAGIKSLAAAGAQVHQLRSE